MSSNFTVEEIEGLGGKTAKKLIWLAREVLNLTEFTSADKIDENIEFITTGSSELNRILGGGFQTGKLTEVYGPFKSGKTNLAHTLAVTTQLPKKKGGLEGTVVYIDTENTFSKEKIKRIARRFGLDPNKVLSKILHGRIYSSDHQSQMIMKSEALCKTRGARLIVVDSLMSLMRAEYVGIGRLAKRQGVLNNMLHGLSRIAETYNCGILVTNQVATKMMGMFSSNDAIGGNIVAHGCHFRVMFKTKGFSSNNSLKRRGIIVDAPDLPPEECEFYITNSGIADDEKVEEMSDSEDIPLNFDPIELCDFDATKIDLIDVKGIGAAVKESLIKCNINNVEELLLYSEKPEELSKIVGKSEEVVNKWLISAKNTLAKA